jgi:hypothetical protein
MGAAGLTPGGFPFFCVPTIALEKTLITFPENQWDRAHLSLHACHAVGIIQWHRASESIGLQKEGHAMTKNTICVWYDKDAEAAARFYSQTFPDSPVGAIHRAPSDYPSGKKGDVLMVEFTVAGVRCIGLNGGPMFKHTEAFSFQISTED